jgi:hypothetical protein
MFTHNIVVRHENGEYEGFSGCGSTAEAAERNAKAKATEEIGAKRLDPATVSYLTKPEFDALDDGTKAMIRNDWRIDEQHRGFGGPEGELDGEFEGVPNDWGIRSAYSRISRIAAPGARRYERGGELLTKAQMLSKAVAKEIAFMGNEDAPTFHAVMDERGDQASVFPITQTEYYRLRAKDITTPKTRERYLDFRVKELSARLSMQDRVDFNSWARRNNPSLVDKVGYLERVVLGLSSTPATFAPPFIPPDMSRPAP